MSLIDPFGRTITYLRVSVTDRCDFRCTYCMAEDMTFRPKAELLSLEELDRVCSTFVERGVRKLRLTGGEPLVRRGIMDLIRSLSRHLKTGDLDELTLTTNGSQLAKYADDLAACGIKRINVSLDTLDSDRFTELTRRGRLSQVLEGIEAARQAGLKIKINAVALKGINESEFDQMIEWCGKYGFDMTLIETMPMGEIDGDRTDHYLPLVDVRSDLESRWTLSQSSHNTLGPSKYLDIAETGGRIGFITPMSNHFCDDCNRVRLTCTGTLFMCLGQDSAVDLRAPLRASESNDLLNAAIDEAIFNKPRGHDFVIAPGKNAPAVARHMSVTGG